MAKVEDHILQTDGEVPRISFLCQKVTVCLLVILIIWFPAIPTGMNGTSQKKMMYALQL